MGILRLSGMGTGSQGARLPEGPVTQASGSEGRPVDVVRTQVAQASGRRAQKAWPLAWQPQEPGPGRFSGLYPGCEIREPPDGMETGIVKNMSLFSSSIRSVMQKYLEERHEITFDKIFNQRIGHQDCSCCVRRVHGPVAHWLMASTRSDVWFCRSAQQLLPWRSWDQTGIALVGISRPMKK
ncbi:hypothetical protein Celaphus_00000181 [Cervus elaphus hippelaphus]|uniref:Uncharacterized protein n=1 Tax=Cervus elaphus hippelaphus TaxID=46360 RepID=A0A212D8T3_CEREH|nr:hypothetical protein Celaphus_00000181 [Cervus elaphus hippelaphus]